MDLNEKPLNVGKETVNSWVDFEQETGDVKNLFLELQEKGRKAEEKCALLESEIDRRNHEFAVLEAQKLVVENEARILKRRNEDLEERIDRIEKESKIVGKGADENGAEEDKILMLMTENNVLACEKLLAEREAEDWKEKFKQLELRLVQLEEIMTSKVLEGNPSRMIEEEIGLQIKDSNDKGEAKVYKGWKVVDGTKELQSQNNLVDLSEAEHGATGVRSTCSPPAKGTADPQASAATPIGNAEGENRGRLLHSENVSHVKKQLVFGEQGRPSKKMAPTTPGGVRPTSAAVIDISDSDDEADANSASGKYNSKTLLEQIDEEDLGGLKNYVPGISTPKRKRASNIIYSESESDDDNTPLCKLKRTPIQGPMSDKNFESCSPSRACSGKIAGDSVTRRRLVKLSNCPGNHGPRRGNLNTGETKYTGISTTDSLEADEVKDESDTESSLGGFIVDSSEVSEGMNCSSDISARADTPCKMEGASDDDEGFDEVLSRICRKRNNDMKWEFEADMLADFGKDPEICMEAVCALYRQQTAEEKLGKETIHSNQRGFSHCDARRGSTLAEFLTDGDPEGGLTKSVDDLHEYDSKGLELCRTLATRYSKQLFAIYNNKEDPFFSPS